MKDDLTQFFFCFHVSQQYCSYKISIVATMSRIAQQFFHWLPSHLTAVILVILKNQISKFHEEPSTKGVRPYHGYFQYASLYLITGKDKIINNFINLTFYEPHLTQ